MSYTLKYTGSEIDDILDRAAPSGALDAAIAAKQDALTFDDAPTENSDNPVKSGGIYDALAEKADTDGNYPELTAGTAEQVLATTGITNKVPYLFRHTPSGAGKRLLDKLVGGTVAWNQLRVVTKPYSATVNSVVLTNNQDGTITVNGQASAQTRFEIIAASQFANKVTGHKILMCGCPSGGASNKYCLVDNYQSANQYDVGYGKIYNVTGTTISISLQISGGYNAQNLVFTPQVYDLTAMFGATIADYLLSLESGAAGAGIAKLKEWGFFTKPYYAYNAGALMSVNAGAHKTVGKNLFDAASATYVDGKIINDSGAEVDNVGWGYVGAEIPVMGGATYTISGTLVNSSYGGRIYQYDANKNFLSRADGFTSTPKTFTVLPNCAYIGFQYGSNIIVKESVQVQIGSTATAYKPYDEHTYTLDSSLTLRGLYKLDASNNLYCDGDEYESDGTVTRKYGIVDLSTLSWTWQTNWFQSTGITGIKYVSANTQVANAIASNYTIRQAQNMSSAVAGELAVDTSNVKIATGSNQTSPTGYLIYELATPTTETATPYTNPQICDPNGTEEYTDASVEAGTRDVGVPVGHETEYPTDLVAEIERVMVAVPAPPTSDGSYTLQVDVSGGVQTYGWASGEVIQTLSMSPTPSMTLDRPDTLTLGDFVSFPSASEPEVVAAEPAEEQAEQIEEAEEE